MKISLRWLSEYVDHSFTPDELSDRLTSLGIEVDAIEDQAKRFGKIVVGEIIEAVQHPNADKLRLTQVNIGLSEPLKIVCGAPNARAGLKVAVATVGADLGEGFVIKKSKIRGEVSEGMLCSAKELGLSEEHDGIIELPINTTVGIPFSEAIKKNDVILEIGITPNRADCLSHIGIAREVAIAAGKSIKKPTINKKFFETSGAPINSVATVTITDPELCPRYAARIVRGVTIQESPQWLRERLEAVGLRPRNNIVDITNFVLMECGHPLHAFDFSKVTGGHIVVRPADGFAQKFITLDDKERELPTSALLISDPDKPLAIAGIMGGGNSEIEDSTTDVLIESAYFNPSSIRRSSKLLALSTDASYRFERGVDMENVLFALDRAAALMVELAGGEVLEGVIDEYPRNIEPKIFSFRPERANTLIGAHIENAVMEQALISVGCTVENFNSSSWLITVPSWRVDMSIEVDAIEEIARIIGYDNLPISAEDRVPMRRERDVLSKLEFEQIVRAELIALGCSECISTPMLSVVVAEQFHPKPVEVMNPLNVGLERMRTSMIANLLDVARRNERHSASGQRLFELGSVFHYSSKNETIGSVAQDQEISILLKDALEEKTIYNIKEQHADLFVLRGVVEQLIKRSGVVAFEIVPFIEIKDFGDWSLSNQYLESTEAVGVVVGKELVGFAGKLSSSVVKLFDLRSAPYVATISYDKLHRLARAVRLQERTIQALPKYPSLDRDIAVIVDRSVTAAQMLETIRIAVPKELLEHLRMFDVFESKEMRAEGKRSFAARLTLRSNERTLEDAEIDTIISSAVQQLSKQVGAIIRA